MYCSGDIFTFYLCPMQFYFVFECAQALFINVKTENSKIHIFQIQIIVSKISLIYFACWYILKLIEIPILIGVLLQNMSLGGT